MNCSYLDYQTIRNYVIVHEIEMIIKKLEYENFKFSRRRQCYFIQDNK